MKEEQISWNPLKSFPTAPNLYCNEAPVIRLSGHVIFSFSSHFHSSWEIWRGRRKAQVPEEEEPGGEPGKTAIKIFLFEALEATDQEWPSLGAFPSEVFSLALSSLHSSQELQFIFWSGSVYGKVSRHLASILFYIGASTWVALTIRFQRFTGSTG